MHFENKLRIVLKLIESYQLPQPLNLYLKDHSRLHRNMGSRDRKFVASVSYAWFRLGHAMQDVGVTQRLAAALLLADHARFVEFNRWIWEQAFPATDMPSGSFSDKVASLESLVPSFNLFDILPGGMDLSEGTDRETWCEHLFRQPWVWARVKRAFVPEVNDELKKLEMIPDAILRDGVALGFDGYPRLTETKSYSNGWMEIQDLTSQQTFDFLTPSEGEKWWDCCAGSGGKSMMLADGARVELTVSDVREATLHNLGKRFKRAGINRYHLHNCDLEKGPCPEVIPASMDGIIADLPCSGSGTWARSPEQIASFGKNQALQLSILQRSIVTNAWPALKPGGRLAYITCSVFRDENENMVEILEKELPGAVLTHATLLNALPGKSDQMFIAILQKKV